MIHGLNPRTENEWEVMTDKHMILTERHGLRTKHSLYIYETIKDSQTLIRDSHTKKFVNQSLESLVTRGHILSVPVVIIMWSELQQFAVTLFGYVAYWCEVRHVHAGKSPVLRNTKNWKLLISWYLH